MGKVSGRVHNLTVLDDLFKELSTLSGVLGAVRSVAK